MIEWIIAGWLTCMLPVKFAPDWVFVDPIGSFIFIGNYDPDYVRGACMLISPVLILMQVCWLISRLLRVGFVKFCQFIGR